ncbi:MAG: NUDIX hydrolase [Phycisphaerae bacterium]
MTKPYLQMMRELVGKQCILMPGVRALVLDDDGKVLLQKRTDVARWGLPGGSVELDETASQAMCREVFEETNLTVDSYEPMGLYSGPDQRLEYPNGDRIQCFSVAFIVRMWKGTPQADGVEGSELRFFDPAAPPDELVEMHRQTLEDFRRYNGEFFVT